MRKIATILAVTVTATCLLFVNVSLAGRPAERQVKQQKRIHQGVKSGEVTKKEYRHLQKQQAKNQRSKQRAWSDGKLTKKERVRIEHQQDKASRHIYRAKHNDADRN